MKEYKFVFILIVLLIALPFYAPNSAGARKGVMAGQGFSIKYARPIKPQSASVSQIETVLNTLPTLKIGKRYSAYLSRAGDHDCYKLFVPRGVAEIQIVLQSDNADNLELYASFWDVPSPESYNLKSEVVDRTTRRLVIWNLPDGNVPVNIPNEKRYCGWLYLMVYSKNYAGAQREYSYTLESQTIQSYADGITHRYALLVGINEYNENSNLTTLRYTHNDVNDWYNLLHYDLGYIANSHSGKYDEIYILGEKLEPDTGGGGGGIGPRPPIYIQGAENNLIYISSTSNDYVRYDGVATEYNIKSYLNYLVNQADADDIVAFVFSGHGDINGDVGYLCAWDFGAGENGEDGKLTEYEIKDIVGSAAAKVFLFFDSCYSGFIDAPIQSANGENIIILTAGNHTTREFDSIKRSAWTYSFLKAYRDYLSEYNYNYEPTAEQIYNQAKNIYYDLMTADPTIHDGNEGQDFYLSRYC